MVERYRRKGRQKLLGNHQKCWIWGKNPVLETLRAEKWQPLELLCNPELSSDIKDEILQKAIFLNIPVIQIPSDDIEKKCHSREHQGLAAKMPPFPYDSPEVLLQENLEKAFLLVLDSIQDSHNLGAMIRTAEVLGCTGIVIGEKNQVGVTSQVVRSSAGAVNHLPIIQVEDLASMIDSLKQNNYSVVAASEKAEQSLEQFQFSNKTALIIGNEGSGITPELLKMADSHVAITQTGKIDSLNAAISSSLFIYEYHRQLASS
jgi:23S rRNA (guanosine2251-2'-O)-methyltransferase